MILCDLTQGWLYRVKYSSYAKLLMSFLCSLYTSDEFTEQEPPLFDRAFMRVTFQSKAPTSGDFFG